jgi:ATP-dependent helicase YprA (DUF1998 family)
MAPTAAGKLLPVFLLPMVLHELGVPPTQPILFVVPLRAIILSHTTKLNSIMDNWNKQSDFKVTLAVFAGDINSEAGADVRSLLSESRSDATTSAASIIMATPKAVHGTDKDERVSARTRYVRGLVGRSSALSYVILDEGHALLEQA